MLGVGNPNVLGKITRTGAWSEPENGAVHSREFHHVREDELELNHRIHREAQAIETGPSWTAFGEEALRVREREREPLDRPQVPFKGSTVRRRPV